MTQRAVFTDEEWRLLVSAPALAGMAVSAAERGGNLRESLALARMYAEARASKDHTELIGALFEKPPVVRREEIQAPKPDALLDRAADAVSRASQLLRERATERELREFGDFVVFVTEAVAHAHKEGGVLGIGGQEVSEREHEALERIAYALGPRPGSD